MNRLGKVLHTQRMRFNLYCVLPFVQFRKLFCDCVIVADLHLLSSGVLGGEAKLVAELIIVHAGAVVVGVRGSFVVL